jgi:hypothetical protein
MSPGKYNVTFTATDASGNEGTMTCEEAIKVIDDGKPSITCPTTQTTLSVESSKCEAKMADLMGDRATENCGKTTLPVTQSPAMGTLLNLGEQDVTFTATRNIFNVDTKTCEKAIKVIDDVKPSITCPTTQTTLLATGGRALMKDLTGKVNATDNCDTTLTVTQSPANDTPMSPGKYNVTFTATDDSGNVATKTCPAAVYVNGPPDCSKAFANPSDLWPPNHKFRSVLVQGVTDPNTDAAVKITVTGIFQDEPVNTQGDGNTCPDAKITPTGGAEVLAERSGTSKVPGDGRVYHIKFKADDGKLGGTCDGEVTVCVPHDQGNRKKCVDGGLKYDSTKCS